MQLNFIIFWQGRYPVKFDIKIKIVSLSYGEGATEQDINDSTSYKDTAKDVLDAYGKIIQSHSITTIKTSKQIQQLQQTISSFAPDFWQCQ